MKKADIIFDVIAIILVVVMIIVAVSFKQELTKVYVQKWVSPDTGVCYLITGNAIIEMHNPDGSICVEK